MHKQTQCNCPACNVFEKQMRSVFNELAIEERLSDDEKRMMSNEIEDLTGYNLG